MGGRARAPPILIDTTPIAQSLGALGPLVFHQVRRTPDEALFNSLLAHYHYLGYQQPVGEHLKYLVVAGDRPVTLRRPTERTRFSDGQTLEAAVQCLTNR